MYAGNPTILPALRQGEGMVRSWFSVLLQAVMAWAMSQGTTLPTEGKNFYYYGGQ